MISRIFKLRVRPEQKQAFEKDFQDISLPYVRKQSGLMGMTVGNPTKWEPNDYLLITNWEDEQALIKFAGEKWNEAVIPAGMEKYIFQCSVDHYDVIEQS